MRKSPEIRAAGCSKRMRIEDRAGAALTLAIKGLIGVNVIGKQLPIAKYCELSRRLELFAVSPAARFPRHARKAGTFDFV
jgi:hypothetical protein